MYCTQCGTHNSETSQFCRNCGEALRARHSNNKDEYLNSEEKQHTKHTEPHMSPSPYVITSNKLVTLALLTFGFYYCYWFYRHFKSFKNDRHWEITPWLRALFWPLTSYSLFTKVSEAVEEYDKKQKIYAGAYTALIIVSIIIASILQQALIFLILLSPLFLLLLFLPALLTMLPIISVQKRINFYWKEKHGSKLVLSPFTTRDYIISGIGLLIMVSMLLFILRLNSLFTQFRDPSTKETPYKLNPSPTSSYSYPTSLPTYTPSPTPNATPTSQQSVDSVSSDFLGKWSGTVIQPGGSTSEYSVDITIIPGKVNEKVGTSNYPTLGCGGDLYLLEAISSGITVEERLTSGFTKCVDNVRIILTKSSDGTLIYDFRDNGNTGSGVLKKTQ